MNGDQKKACKHFQLLIIQLTQPCSIQQESKVSVGHICRQASPKHINEPNFKVMAHNKSHVLQPCVIPKFYTKPKLRRESKPTGNSCFIPPKKTCQHIPYKIMRNFSWNQIIKLNKGITEENVLGHIAVKHKLSNYNLNQIISIGN